MKYTVVFDVVEVGNRHWWFPVIGMIFVVIGMGLVLFRRGLPGRTTKFFPFAFLGFAIFWTIFALVATTGGYFGLAAALRDGRCEITEGEVTQFHPMPEGGHDVESFVVSGKQFEYSDFTVSPGFNNTQSHGGPIHAGLRVRIHHVGNDIARLEIAARQPPAAANPQRSTRDP